MSTGLAPYFSMRMATASTQCASAPTRAAAECRVAPAVARAARVQASAMSQPRRGGSARSGFSPDQCQMPTYSG